MTLREPRHLTSSLPVAGRARWIDSALGLLALGLFFVDWRYRAPGVWLLLQSLGSCLHSPLTTGLALFRASATHSEKLDALNGIEDRLVLLMSSSALFGAISLTLRPWLLRFASIFVPIGAGAVTSLVVSFQCEDRFSGQAHFDIWRMCLRFAVSSLPLWLGVAWSVTAVLRRAPRALVAICIALTGLASAFPSALVNEHYLGSRLLCLVFFIALLRFAGVNWQYLGRVIRNSVYAVK